MRIEIFTDPDMEKMSQLWTNGSILLKSDIIMFLIGSNDRFDIIINFCAKLIRVQYLWINLQTGFFLVKN